MFHFYLVASILLTLSFSSAQELVNCTLCSNANDTLGDPDARLNTGEETLTCLEIYNRGVLQLPVANCTALQAFGASLCLCGSSPPSLNDCTLCEDGSSLEEPLLEGLTGDTCAELQLDAQSDDEKNCYTWQGTVGVYCGCENNIVSSVLACRLCGDDILLPDPLDIDTNTTGDSCGKLEFEASLPGANCSDYQEQYGSYCCRNVPPPTPTSSGTGFTAGVVSLLAVVCIIMYA